jgi:hypothetical protein
MSGNRRTILACIEQDPELRPLVPLIRVILESPGRSVGGFVAFAELWTRLTSEMRVLLLLHIKEDAADLPVEEIARLVGVHRRTLYKSENFKQAYAHLRRLRRGSIARGRKDEEGVEADFDPWE